MPRTSQQDSATAFLALHASPPGFLMPNAWDAGSAVVLADAGFKAIGTTSAGIAFSLGKPDYDVRDSRRSVPREQMFERLRQIVDAVSIPVNGDLEAGYGETPEAVAGTIRLAIQAGLAGGNIEDKDPLREGLFDEQLVAERIAAARAAIEASGSAFVLTARSDALLFPAPDALAATIRRCNLYREAGADCLFPTGAADPAVVGTLVREIHGPLNVVVGLKMGPAGGGVATDPRALLDAGVRRISLGGSIARAALGFVRRAAEELRDRGTMDFSEGQIPQRELNALFTRAPVREPK